MLAVSSYSESRETQQPLCGTRPHSQATADGPEGGPGILTLDKTPVKQIHNCLKNSTQNIKIIIKS